MVLAKNWVQTSLKVEVKQIPFITHNFESNHSGKHSRVEVLGGQYDDWVVVAFQVSSQNRVNAALRRDIGSSTPRDTQKILKWGLIIGVPSVLIVVVIIVVATLFASG